jgi:hypothetical protein
VKAVEESKPREEPVGYSATERPVSPRVLKASKSFQNYVNAVHGDQSDTSVVSEVSVVRCMDVEADPTTTRHTIDEPCAIDEVFLLTTFESESVDTAVESQLLEWISGEDDVAEDDHSLQSPASCSQNVEVEPHLEHNDLASCPHSERAVITSDASVADILTSTALAEKRQEGLATEITKVSCNTKACMQM